MKLYSNMAIFQAFTLTFFLDLSGRYSDILSWLSLACVGGRVPSCQAYETVFG